MTIAPKRNAKIYPNIKSQELGWRNNTSVYRVMIEFNNDFQKQIKKRKKHLNCHENNFF